MGKGDIRTRRGKIYRGSYGVTRPRRKRRKGAFALPAGEAVLPAVVQHEAPPSVVPEPEPAPAEIAVAESAPQRKKPVPRKKPALKKTVSPKPAPKKPTAKKMSPKKKPAAKKKKG